MPSPSLLARAGSTLALVCALSSVAHAQAFVENPDAGQTVATASISGPLNFQPLIAISGNLTPLVGSSNDVDFYLIEANPAAFSASTANIFTTAGLDTILFLLETDGRPVVLNDDAASGTTLSSTLPIGSLTGGARRLILGISVSGIDPVTAANQFLFANGLLSTDLRGPNPSVTGVLGGFLDAGLGNTGGAYQIVLTGANAVAVPETSTVVAGAFAVGAAGFAFLRRRRAAVVPA